MKLTFFGAAHAVIRQLPLPGGQRQKDPHRLRSSAGPGRARRKRAGFRPQLHRLRHRDPRPYRPLRPDPPAGERGLSGPDLRHPSDLSADVGHAAGLRLHPGERRGVANQKGKRAGPAPVEPLYTVADAEAALQQLFPAEYGQTWTCATVCASASGTRGTFWAPPWWRSGPQRAASLKSWSFPATWAISTSPSSAIRSFWTRPTMWSGVHLRRPEP